MSVATSDATPSHYEPPRLLFVIPVLGVTQILAWGSSYYLLAVLAQPIATDTGWPLDDMEELAERDRDQPGHHCDLMG